MDKVGFSESLSRMLCKVLLLIFFSLGRTENLIENMPGSWPQVMPWPVPWYMQGIMLGSRPDDIQEETEEMSEIRAEEPENLVQENQEEKSAEYILFHASPDLKNNLTRILKRGKRSGPRDTRIRIPQN